MPAWRHLRGLGQAVVDHPAPLDPDGLVLAAPTIVLVAEIVGADVLAVEPRPDLRAKSLAVPPGEESEEEVFQAPIPFEAAGLWRSAPRLSRETWHRARGSTTG